VKFEPRAANGVAAAYSASVSAGSSPIRLKLVRSGVGYNQFGAWFSLNGSVWTQVGVTQPVTMTSAALAGLAVTSHNNTAGSLNTAVVDNVALSATVTGDQSVVAQSDALRVVRSGAFLDVYLNNTSAIPSYRYDYASLTSLTLSGAAGDDTFTIDYTAGTPVPAGGISVDGAAGANSLALIGAGPGAISVTSGLVNLTTQGPATPAPSLAITGGSTVTASTSPLV